MSLSTEAGDTMGLLGRNGAGKTTHITIVAGLLDAHEGEVLIDARPSTWITPYVSTAQARERRPGACRDVRPVPHCRRDRIERHVLW